ncbi:hypothetical protein SAMN05421755_10515 [Nitrosomonas sp. Nm33]|nr:hypothetical protein SAMN05421755_10515 [Nitrosomonas sp. Nm33]
MECAALRVQDKAQRRGMVIPFQGVAMQSCTCKIVQSAPKHKHLKGMSEIYKNYNIHTVNNSMSD